MIHYIVYSSMSYVHTPRCLLDTWLQFVYIDQSPPVSPIHSQLHVLSTHLQLIGCCNCSTVVTPAGSKATFPGVLVHVLPQDHLPALLKCALHAQLGALVQVLLVVTVLPFPAAPLIGTGYMECVQLSGDSFVRKELCKLEEWAHVEIVSY